MNDVMFMKKVDRREQVFRVATNYHFGKTLFGRFLNGTVRTILHEYYHFILVLQHRTPSSKRSCYQRNLSNKTFLLARVSK